MGSVYPSRIIMLLLPTSARCGPVRVVLHEFVLRVSGAAGSLRTAESHGPSLLRIPNPPSSTFATGNIGTSNPPIQ